MKNISFDEMVRYILILREEGMGNNYRLKEDQINLMKKVQNSLKDEPMLKKMLDDMARASSMTEIYEIYSGKKIETPELSVVKKENIVAFENEKLENKTAKVQERSEGGRQFTKMPVNNRRAGYVDALVMALITGFIGGISTAIIFMMIK